MSHGPIEPMQHKRMNELAQFLDHQFNGDATGNDRQVGFVLLSFKFGEQENGRINYISNADRADIITGLKELVARFEGRYTEPQGDKPQ